MDLTNIDWNKAVNDTLADYEKQKNAANSGRREIDLTDYFTLRLADKESSGVRRFRILPMDETGKWYELKKYHNIKVGKNWQKLYDPAQDGRESPIDWLYKELMNGDEDDKKIASKYRSRYFYIVRGIERGKENEGVKFWRFPKVNDGTGIMDKIQPIMKYLNDKNPGSGAFFNPIQGRDLIISVVRDNVKGYTKVSQIMPDDPSPLSDNQELMASWLNDSKVWSDVYREKPVEYLKIIAEGGEPVWDAEQKKFIAKIDGAPQASIMAAQPTMDSVPQPTDLMGSQQGYQPANTTTISVDDLDTDDLPF